MEEMIAHRSGMTTMAGLSFLSELFLYKFLSRRERDEENRKSEAWRCILYLWERPRPWRVSPRC